MALSRKNLAPYAIATAGVALATLLRWAAEPWLQGDLPFIAHLLVVLVLARAMPLMPTLFALVLGAIVAGHLFVVPGDPGAQGEYVRYFIVGIAMAAVCEAMRSTERQSAERQRILAATTDAALDCIVTVDLDDRIVEFNPSAERTFGRSRDSAIGRDVREVILPPDARERHAAGLARRLESGELDVLNRRLEAVAVRADGTRFPIELTVTRLEVEGKPLFTAFVRDVTEQQGARRALQESESRFRRLIEQVVDYAIFTLDLEGRATSWNEGVRRVLGYDESEFIGVDFAPLVFLFEDIEAGVPQRELRDAARTGAANNDRWMRRKDGTKFFAVGVTMSYHDADGKMIGYAKIMRDQTTRKQLEERLRDTANDLAAAMENQTRFLAILSHELRNPMAALRNAAEVLRLTSGDKPAPVVDIVGRQVQHMGRLIDDLLDASRIRSGRINLQREAMDLGVAIDQALELSRPYCVQHELDLRVEKPGEPLTIDGDFARIVQVIGNLVHNACKFTPRGGSIVVRARRDESAAEVRVIDNGIGIAGDHLDHIFDIFRQVDAMDAARHGGLGIGLSVVKSLVEMHGGTIEARSQGETLGSEFIVRLPLVEALQAEAAAPPRDIGRRRFLVVDDNRDAAESLTMLLEMHGHEVVAANDGPECLFQMQRHTPEIALLDIGLPGMSGYEVAQRIRALPEIRGTILVAVTGWGQDEDRHKTREAGFDAHLTKPIDYGQLAEVLAGLLERPRATGT